MKQNEFTEMTGLELSQKLTALKAQLYSLRFSLATRQLENTSEIALCKKNIARCLTEMRSRELNAAAAKA